MDSSTKQFSLFLLLITLLPLFQTHARENQFFNKASPTTAAAESTAIEPQQPKFLPDNGNTYGLYGHDSSQLPSTAAAVEKPLNDYFPNNYNQEAALDDTNVPAFTKQNNYYNGGGGSSFNSRPFGGFQHQGMSDTRFLENGKYFYDVNTERYGRNRPYQVLRGDRARNEYYNNNNFYGNNRNAYEGYQNNQDVFDDEADDLP